MTEIHKSGVVSLGFFDWSQDIYTKNKPYACLMPLTHAPKDFPPTNIESTQQNIRITSIRGRESEFSLDTHGFEMIQHDPKFDDWQNGKRVVKEYYPYIVDLLKTRTGADEVHIFDHTVRLGDHGTTPLHDSTPDRMRQYQGTPSTMAHVDHSLSAAINHAKDDFGPLAEDKLRGRFQIINFWHPIREPVEQNPLAICDYRSVKDDCFPADLIYPHIFSENVLIRHSDAQQWYYQDNQMIREAWLIKIADTAAEQDRSIAKYSAHTSFVVPWARKDAPQRQSIEFRAYVFHLS